MRQRVSQHSLTRQHFSPGPHELSPLQATTAQVSAISFVSTLYHTVEMQEVQRITYDAYFGFKYLHLYIDPIVNYNLTGLIKI
jgi:hypothetical protein